MELGSSKFYFKIVSKPSFVSQKIFSESLVAVHKIKKNVNFEQASICWNMCIRFELRLSYLIIIVKLKLSIMIDVSYCLLTQIL